jgi:hypothetical protein
MKPVLVQTPPPLVGALYPRLHTPWLKTKTRGGEIAELAEKIGQPLLPWQRIILDDMCSIDDEGKFKEVEPVHLRPAVR